MFTKLLRLFLSLKYRSIGGTNPQDKSSSILGAVRWLCAAQDALPHGGISRAYSLRLGWELPYPETTGYIIPTFLAMDPLFPELGLRERGWRAGYWLADVQFDSGAICSKQHRPGNTKPSVFNTGMVLHGWVSLLEQKHDERIAQAAHRAVAWLTSEQEADGSWVKHAFNGTAHTYYTMVDWALVRYAQLTAENEARTAATRNLNWVLDHQRENGWFDLCWFQRGDAVTTHTISYTTQGLVESGRILGDERYVLAASRGSEPLRHRFEELGELPGTFDEEWRPTSTWECCTGNAQTSLVWQALGKSTDDQKWETAAQELNRHMLRYQKLQSRLPEINGAIPGSLPVSGRYDSFNFPNHAAKFFVDALSFKTR